MKLALLLFDYFPYGGLQRDCLGVARVCATRGHAVTILTRTWQGDRPAGIHVTVFGRQGLTLVSQNRHWLAQLKATPPQQRFDGVVGFNKLPGLDVYYGADPCYVAKMARLKPVWYRWTRRYRHYRGLEEAVFRRGARTHALLLTAEEIPLYQRHYQTEIDRFTVLPPGIVRRDFSEAKRHEARVRLRTELGNGPEEKLVLFVGSGFRVKGLDRVIRAMAALPKHLPARLLVVGRGSPGRFAWLARALGVARQTEFLGGRQDVSDLMLASDLLLLPSRSESAGIVLLEALSLGLPVLTTASCGYAFHIERAAAGRVLPSPFDQARLNQVLAEMLMSPELPGWRAAGLAYAGREDLYSCHERAAEMIEKVVAAKGLEQPCSN